MWLPRQQKQRRTVALALTEIMTLSALIRQLHLVAGLQQQPDDLSRSASREWSDEMRDLGGDNPQSESKSSTDLAESENPPHDNYQQFLNKILPTFDNSTATNITTTAGKTVFLPCNVRHLADKTVSWIRRPADAPEDLTVLTVGRYTYTHDQRIRSVHLDSSESWVLEIKYPQPRDSGVYECQVSTLPKISRFITLNVVVSRARIIGGPQLFVNAGSRLNVSCVVDAPGGGTDFVFWSHNNGILSLDARRDQLAIILNTDPLRQQTISSLVIRSVQTSDSGNYTCTPSNAEQDSIQLVVLNNDTPAAMQDSLSSQGACSWLVHRELLLWMLALPVYLLL
ncbi:hemicentin-2-like isoform X2 [Varroa jacobsoni]|uniref:Ig-like domain-containing protein n=1 Tax=Varroa destructor TaxID=109461 RepID=A0A7M7L5W0_VARDE|nr:hemicentin-2-like isoform X2 [Varroa destructor]XP_022696570.1 hemicentin-2-like isoform X2 [Varroa jacobsoni]